MSSLPAKLLESSKAIGFRLVLLSLAEAEFYNNQQQSSLEDYLELSVMLQHNNNTL